MEQRDLDLVRLTIAICKQEVESSIGEGVIEAVDDGSPWGRAFMLVCQQLKQPDQQTSP